MICMLLECIVPERMYFIPMDTSLVNGIQCQMVMPSYTMEQCVTCSLPLNDIDIDKWKHWFLKKLSSIPYLCKVIFPVLSDRLLQSTSIFLSAWFLTMNIFIAFSSLL
jgi:hypothetical protein